jgi:hypothetical protein
MTLTEEHLKDIEEGIYRAKNPTGSWQIIEIRGDRVLPVWPWYERYRYTLVPNQFVLGEKISPPAPVRILTDGEPKVLEP